MSHYTIPTHEYFSSFRLYATDKTLFLAGSRAGQSPGWELLEFDRKPSSPPSISSIIRRHHHLYQDAELDALVVSASDKSPCPSATAVPAQLRSSTTGRLINGLFSVFGSAGTAEGNNKESTIGKASKAAFGGRESPFEEQTCTADAVPVSSAPAYLSAVGFLGAIAFTRGYYLVLVTRSEPVGTIGGHLVHAPRAVEVVPVHFEGAGAGPQATMGETLSKWVQEMLLSGTDPGIMAEGRYQSLFLFLDLTKEFYFSYTYDLTRPLQNAVKLVPIGAPLEAPPPPTPEPMFVWNSYLRETVGLNISSSESERKVSLESPWTVPLIHGFFSQITLSVLGAPVLVSLLARRSRFFAGARYLKRGADDEGHCANEVETEQIVDDTRGGISSFLQLRGSIPSHWSQRTSVAIPRPPILLQPRDVTFAPARAHAARILGRYGAPPLYLNLVKKKEPRSHQREKLVGREMARSVAALNKELPPHLRIQYLSIDYNQVVKSKRHNVLAVLRDVARWSINSTGFFCCAPSILPPPSPPKAHTSSSCTREGSLTATTTLFPFPSLPSIFEDASVEKVLRVPKLTCPPPTHIDSTLRRTHSVFQGDLRVQRGVRVGPENKGGPRDFSCSYFQGLCSCGGAPILKWRHATFDKESFEGGGFKLEGTSIAHGGFASRAGEKSMEDVIPPMELDFSRLPALDGLLKTKASKAEKSIISSAPLLQPREPYPPQQQLLQRDSIENPSPDPADSDDEDGGAITSMKEGESDCETTVSRVLESEQSAQAEAAVVKAQKRSKGATLSVTDPKGSEDGGEGLEVKRKGDVEQDQQQLSPNPFNAVQEDISSGSAPQSLKPSQSLKSTTPLLSTLFANSLLSEEDSLRPDPCRIFAQVRDSSSAATAAGLSRYTVACGGGDDGIFQARVHGMDLGVSSHIPRSTSNQGNSSGHLLSLASRLRDAESLGGEGEYLYIDLLGTQGVQLGEGRASSPTPPSGRDGVSTIRFQKGVLRTNCVDCLDRTNVAQASVGVHVLGLQLRALSVTSVDTLEPSGAFARVLMDLYVAHGDAIALQYGGSEANKKMTAQSHEESVKMGDAAERCGVERGNGSLGGTTAWPTSLSNSLFSGASSNSLTSTLFRYNSNFKLSSSGPAEILTSLQRFYSNSFTDSIKQDAINVFLGVYRPKMVAAASTTFIQPPYTTITHSAAASSSSSTNTSFASSLLNLNPLKQQMVTPHPPSDLLAGSHLWDMESDYWLHHPSCSTDEMKGGLVHAGCGDGLSHGGVQTRKKKWYWPGNSWWEGPLDDFQPPPIIGSKCKWWELTYGGAFLPSTTRNSPAEAAAGVGGVPAVLGKSCSKRTGMMPSLLLSLSLYSPPPPDWTSLHSESTQHFSDLSVILNTPHLKPYPAISKNVFINSSNLVAPLGSSGYSNAQWYISGVPTHSDAAAAATTTVIYEGGGVDGESLTTAAETKTTPSSILRRVFATQEHTSAIITRQQHMDKEKDSSIAQGKVSLTSSPNSQHHPHQHHLGSTRTLSNPHHSSSLFFDVLGHPDTWRLGPAVVRDAPAVFASDAVHVKEDTKMRIVQRTPPLGVFLTECTTIVPAAPIINPLVKPSGSTLGQQRSVNPPVAPTSLSSFPLSSFASSSSFPSKHYPYPNPPSRPSSIDSKDYTLFEMQAAMASVVKGVSPGGGGGGGGVKKSALSIPTPFNNQTSASTHQSPPHLRPTAKAFLTNEKKDVEHFRQELSICGGVSCIRDLDATAPTALLSESYHNSALPPPPIPLNQFLQLGMSGVGFISGPAVPPHSMHLISTASNLTQSTREFEFTQSANVLEAVKEVPAGGVFQGVPRRKPAGSYLLSHFRETEEEREDFYRAYLYGERGRLEWEGQGGHLFYSPVGVVSSFSISG